MPSHPSTPPDSSAPPEPSTPSTPPVQTGGRRISWPDLPQPVRHRIERELGRTVTGALDQPGGFSEGLTARLRLSDGTGVFVKAASSLTGPAAATHHRREQIVSARLPARAPVPRLLHTHDDGDWVVLVFEEIDGHLPAQPWRRDELDRVLEAVTDLAHDLTPAPIPAHLLGTPRLGGWTRLTQDTTGGAGTGGAAGTGDRLRAVSPWAFDHLDHLAALEAAAAPGVAGSTLQHGDLYPFNLMLTPNRVVVVDWPHAWIGAAHCDVLTLLSGVRLSDLDPQPIADTHPLTRHLSAEQIDGMLALHSGFLLRTALSAEPGADPALLSMMFALGLASVRWLADRS